MEDCKFLIEIMEWSFSRLQLFYNCPYSWKLIYLDKAEKEDNFFSQYGSFGHKVLEKYIKKELSDWNVANYYKDNFDSYVDMEIYSKYDEWKINYYEQGLEYFSNISLNIENFNILGIEKEIRFNVYNKPFIGYIDLLLEDKNTNDIIILDHKSAEYPLTKKGKIAKKNVDKFESYKRQLYLYSTAIYDKYKKYPKTLAWNFFRRDKIIEIEFNEEEYNNSLIWAKNTIELIEKEELWLPRETIDYWCNNICSCRDSSCEFRLD